MPKYAGEVVLVDIFAEGRIFRGVVRGVSGMKQKDCVCHWKRRKLMSMSPLKNCKLNQLKKRLVEMLIIINLLN